MKKIVFGFLIMMLGAFLLLNNMGFFIPDVYHWVISWQTLLIAIGVILLFDRPSDHKTAGIVLIFIGSLFLLPKIFPLSVHGLIIPLLIIAAGVAFIIKAATRKNESTEFGTWCNGHHNWKKNFKDFEKNVTINGGGVVRKEYVFAGSKEKWTQGKLKNVEIEATFSGVEIDFTQTELADDIKVAACIKVKSVFSGVILYVPDDWNIMVQKTGVFGGFVDNRPNRVLKVCSDKLVILELEAVFGGGEIKCYE
jgi:predicted membrane protein